MPDENILIFGNDAQSGSYILRLKVHSPLEMAFGRFKRGKRIVVPAGEYVYVGSAMGKKGPASLGRRLLRHATRSGSKAPHPIRAMMLSRFKAIGLGSGDLRPQAGKKLHWNVDYLLDHPAVELSGALIFRSETRLEATLAKLLADDPATFVLEKGLGANDAPGQTHLLGLHAGQELSVLQMTNAPFL